MSDLSPFWSGFIAGCTVGLTVGAALVQRHMDRLQGQFDEAMRIASDAIRNAGCRTRMMNDAEKAKEKPLKSTA